MERVNFFLFLFFFFVNLLFPIREIELAGNCSLRLKREGGGREKEVSSNERSVKLDSKFIGLNTDWRDPAVGSSRERRKLSSSFSWKEDRGFLRRFQGSNTPSFENFLFYRAR